MVKKILGKDATEEEIAQTVANMTLGDTERKIKPMTAKEIMKSLGWSSRDTFYRYLRKAESLGLIEKDLQTNRYKKPTKTIDEEFKEFNESHPITNDPLIQEWKNDLLTRNQGEPLTMWKKRITDIEAVCNTLQVTPRQLVQDKKTTEKIMRNYADMVTEGRVKYAGKMRSKPSINRQEGSVAHKVYFRVQSVRDFCGFYGIQWKRGVGGVMSQNVSRFHGKYADIKLNPEQFDKADQFILNKFGLDSDVYRWFWAGIETCARATALYEMSLDYTTHKSKTTGNVTYIMTAYESKTKHIKGGKWVKYVTWPGLQKSIDLQRQRGVSRLWTPGPNSNSKTKYLNKVIKPAMHEIWQHLNIENRYFFNHYNHVLRHIGAHYWLEKHDYNYGLVAKIGGWNTIDELKNSYGEMPPEKVLELLERGQNTTGVATA